jgi:hypothetical protein
LKRYNPENKEVEEEDNRDEDSIEIKKENKTPLLLKQSKPKPKSNPGETGEAATPIKK